MHRGRTQEAAALALQCHAEGLLVVFSHQRVRIDGLVTAGDELFAPEPPLDSAELKRFAEPLGESDPDSATLA